MRYAIVFLLTLAAVPTWAAAGDVRWISDEITVMLRAGRGNTYQIRQSLPSGARLQLLEGDREYSYVRTDAGTEGWVLTRFLTNQPIAADRLVKAEARIEKLGEQNRTLTEQATQLRSERDQFAETLKSVEKDKVQLEKELGSLRELAASPIRLRDENEAMRSRLGQLEASIDELTITNDALRDSSRREWFITGAGVLGGGILLGLILPHLKRRRRTGMYDF